MRQVHGGRTTLQLSASNINNCFWNSHRTLANWWGTWAKASHISHPKPATAVGKGVFWRWTRCGLVEMRMKGPLHSWKALKDIENGGHFEINHRHCIRPLMCVIEVSKRKRKEARSKARSRRGEERTREKARREKNCSTSTNSLVTL